MNRVSLPSLAEVRQFALTALAVALVYFAVVRLSLILAGRFDSIASIWWPAAGVAAAAAIRFRWPAVAGVLLGEAFANLGMSSLLMLPYLALGSALGTWFFFWLPEKLGATVFSFGSIRDIGRYCLLGIPAGTAVIALTHATVLLNFDALAVEQYWLELGALWAANVTGALLLAPVLLAANRHDWRQHRELFRLEWLMVLVAVMCTAFLIVATHSTQTWEVGMFLLFPLVLWVALRFSAGATTMLVLAGGLEGMAGREIGVGAAELDTAFLDVLGAQVTALSLAVCGLLVTAALAERRESVSRLDRLTNHDPLTGLPNRNHFQIFLEQAIAQCGRTDGQVSVLSIDLDRFKNINDSRGQEVGDEVLRVVADRLTNTLRTDDFVARLGADEFAVVMSHPRTLRAARRVALKLLESLAEPFKIDNHYYAISGSIGISVCPDDGTDANTLLRQSDLAMHRAKEKRSGFEYFCADMNAAAHEQLVIENGIRRALKNGDFALLYQPKLDLRSGRIIGMEALIRWMAPAGARIVGPDKFIPIAEETGLIVPVGQWALRTACRQWVTWRNEGIDPPHVAVNLSPRQFTDGGLARDILQIVEETGMDPSYLALEVTESTAMDNPKVTLQVLDEMSKHGIHMMVDDFGTGHSNLKQLKRLPVEAIKIDKSYVMEVLDDKDDAEIVNAIIKLAHALDLRVVAEGVETQEIAAFLKHSGCDEIQGYLIGKPMPPDAIKALFGKTFLIGEASVDTLPFGSVIQPA